MCIRDSLYTDDDKFCLDGNRLVNTLGIYGENGTKYGTELDTNLRVTSYENNNLPGTGPSHFLVERPDGTKAVYGSTAAALG